MNNESSEWKYSFDKGWLNLYKQGMKFPYIEASVGAQTRVADIDNPLAPVIDWYINAVLKTEFPYLNGLKDKRYSVDEAFKEVNSLSKAKGLPQAKDMENMIKIQRYFRELDYAAKCMEQKGVPCDSWPLDAVLIARKDAKENIEKIANVMPIN